MHLDTLYSDGDDDDDDLQGTKNNLDNTNVMGFELYLLKQIANPFRLSWNLIRLGHEPLSPVQFYSPLALFGWSSPVHLYPSILIYVYHTVRTYGLWKVFSTGVFASACMDFTTEVFHRTFQRRSKVWQSWMKRLPSVKYYGVENLMDEIPALTTDGTVQKTTAFHIESQMEEAPLLMFARMLGEALSLKTWEVVCTQPFVVIVLRQVGALIGGESQYAWFPFAVRSVYKENGLAGFFQGIVPRLLGELIVVATYYSACRILRRHFWGLQSKRAPVLRGAQVLIYFGLRNYVYPLELTGCIWSVRGSNLVAATEANSYPTWHALRSYLVSSGQGSRGWLPVLRNHVQAKHLPS